MRMFAFISLAKCKLKTTSTKDGRINSEQMNECAIEKFESWKGKEITPLSWI